MARRSSRPHAAPFSKLTGLPVWTPGPEWNGVFDKSRPDAMARRGTAAAVAIRHTDGRILYCKYVNKNGIPVVVGLKSNPADATIWMVVQGGGLNHGMEHPDLGKIYVADVREVGNGVQIPFLDETALFRTAGAASGSGGGSPMAIEFDDDFDID